ncbi:MAG TPA: hypothetical protein VIF62_18920 [Labilithrix sp.]
MKTKSFARALEQRFEVGDRAGGRALMRRRRVRGKASGPWFEVEVRAPEGTFDVLLAPDDRAVTMSCPCASFGARGACAHAWASLLVLDRHLSACQRIADAREHRDGGVG